MSAMDIHRLTREEMRWIESCALQLRSRAPLLTSVEAIQQACDLHCAWPTADPTEAADVFVASEVVVLPPRNQVAR